MLTFQFQKVVAAGVSDSDKVALSTLNTRYGIPADSVKDSTKLYPTIPSEMIKKCRKGPGHLGQLPLDQQSCLVAAAYVMSKANSQSKSRHFATNINPGGVMFGDPGFRGLNSFKTT